MSRAKVSACIICYNEERNIARCLESLSWCDEIVVVDSGSTDRTLETCQRFNVKLYHRSWSGFIDQKNFALSQCQHSWIFNADADEEVSPILREEIIKVLETDGENGQFNGYKVKRVVFFLGRWWRKGGWYNEFRARLFRKNCVTWAGLDPHEKAFIKGRVGKLSGELLHYTYKDIAHQVQSLNAHSSGVARAMLRRGRQAHLINIFLNPLFRFFKFYFIKRGFLQGLPGLFVAISEAYYVFLKYTKLWELHHIPNQAALSDKTLPADEPKEIADSVEAENTIINRMH